MARPYIVITTLPKCCPEAQQKYGADKKDLDEHLSVHDSLLVYTISIPEHIYNKSGLNLSEHVF